MAKAAELMLEEVERLESSYHAAQGHLRTLSRLWKDIRAGGNNYLEHLHKKVFHETLKMELHGVLEGATVVSLMLPHDVAGAHLSNLRKLGPYSEALVALALIQDDSECKLAGKDLQSFCISLCACTRHLRCGMEIYEACNSEELFFQFIEERTAHYKRLAKRVAKCPPGGSSSGSTSF